MRIVTLVPYRPAGQRHRWLWDMTKPALEDLGYELFVGEPRGKEWSRAEACNAASRKAGRWDIALVADCDTIPDPLSIRRGIMWVTESGGAVRPHGERTMLNQAGTLVFVQRGPGAIEARKHTERQHAGGGLLILTRDAWEAAGGYDERFVGWGYEDTDFNLRLLKHSTWDRLPGKAWHLWHSREDNKPLETSRKRYRALLVENRSLIAAWAKDKGLARPEAVL